MIKRCLTPLSTIFQLYRWSILLVEETGVPGENHRPADNVINTYTTSPIWLIVKDFILSQYNNLVE